jgi:hypothetical protein
MNSLLEDYLTMEFLNDLDIFDYGGFINQFRFEEPKEEENNWNIDVRCIEMTSGLEKEEFDCAICISSHLEINHVLLNCNHKFCYNCISAYLEHNKKENKKPSCALCRESFVTIEIPDVENMYHISNIIQK